MPYSSTRGDKMSVTEVELKPLPPEVQSLLERVPAQYLRDLAIDLAWAALTASRRPDALHQVVQEWEITLEEIDLAGEDRDRLFQTGPHPR